MDVNNRRGESERLPVGETIAFGYAFLIGQFTTVLRICWVPTLIVVGIDYLGRRYALFYSSGTPEEGSSVLDLIVVASSLGAALLASAVMVVGVTRVAMGHPLVPGNFYFAISRTELRMLGANIRYVLATAILFLLAGILSAFALYLAGVDFAQPAESQPAGFAVLAASLLSLAALGYAAVTAIRLAALLPSVVVAEDGGLERASRLTNGNVLRIIAISIALFLPVGLAAAFCEIMIVYAAFGADTFTADTQEMFTYLDVAAAQAPLLWAIYGFVFNIVLMGIYPSAGAFAYRKLAGSRPPPASHGTAPKSG